MKRTVDIFVPSHNKYTPDRFYKIELDYDSDEKITIQNVRDMIIVSSENQTSIEPTKEVRV